MKIRIRFLSFPFIILALLVSGCTRELANVSSKPSQKSDDSIRILTIGTADSGGTMYPVGKSIAQLITQSDSTIELNISASQGSVSNVQSLEAGNIDLGLVSGNIAFSAIEGTGEFEGSPVSGLCALAAVYPSLSNWMALESSGLFYVHELQGKRISVGPQNSATELSAVAVLNSMGITSINSDFVNSGLGSGSQKVLERAVDAVHGFAGVPIGGLAELAETVSSRLLKYTEDELASFIQENPSYYKETIPAGTYPGQEEDVPTFGVKCLLCVKDTMDEELAYELASILYAHRMEMKELHPAMASMGRDSFMYEELPIRLHPGAERFYRENGLLPLKQ